MDSTDNIRVSIIKERNNLDLQDQTIFMLESNQTDLIDLKTQRDIKKEPVDTENYLEMHCIDTATKQELKDLRDHFYAKPSDTFVKIKEESSNPLENEVELALPQTSLNIEDYLQTYPTDTSLKIEEVQITPIKNEVEFIPQQEFQTIIIQDEESNIPLKNETGLMLPQRQQDIKDYLRANLIDTSLKIEETQITAIKDEVELMQPQEFKNIGIQDSESNIPLKIEVELTLPQRPEDIEDYLQANLTDNSLKIEEVQITPIKDEVELMQSQAFKTIDIQDKKSNTPLEIQVELTLPQRSEDIEDYLQANLTDSSLKIEEVQITPNKAGTNLIQDKPIQRSIVCKDCKQEFQDFCPRCPMLLSVLNVFIKYGTPNRAKLTLPKGLLAFRWDEAVVALRDIPAGVTFGPHEGLIMAEKKHGICKFTMSKKKLSCSEVPEFTNWLQFVNYRQTFNEANLVVIQCKTHLYYRSCRLIEKGEELLVYIDRALVGGYCEPILIGSLNNDFVCKNCCMGFSTRVYLRLHMKLCPQVRTSASNRDKVSYCNICDKKFNSGTVLWKHFVTEHTGYKRNSSAKKRKAKSTSSQSKRYNKTIFNGRKFGTYEQLNVIPPRELKQYKCNYCDHLAETKCVDFVEHMLHKYGD